MYKGLFGDLPSTKKGSDASKDAGPPVGPSLTKETDAKPPSANVASETSVLASGEVKTKAKPAVVPRFVPLQMKRPRKIVNVPKKKRVSSKKKEDVVEKAQEAAPERSAGHVFASKTDRDFPKECIQVAPAQEIPTTGMAGQAILARAEEDRSKSVYNPQVNDASPADSNMIEDNEPTIVEEEPEYLRELHEQAKNDLYDPLVPNDLLHYWEHRRSIKEKERLIREQQIALEEHERMRQGLEEERQRLQAEGDVDKIVEHSIQHQQGRKISNVPAWLLEQQRAQREESGSGGGL